MESKTRSDDSTDHTSSNDPGEAKPNSSTTDKSDDNDADVPEIKLTGTQKMKLSTRRTALARALTTRSSSSAVLKLAIGEAEENMPDSVQEFAEAVFNSLADPETQRLEVDGKLAQALKLMGHNTNNLALKDICVRFHLEFPHHRHHETSAEISTEGAEQPHRQNSQPSRLQSRDEESDEESSTRVRGATTISLETFIGVVYSELIDQAQSSDLSKSFALFDQDNNGEVDMKEFEAGLLALGDMNPLDVDGRKAFLDKIDVDGDDQLSAQELITWLANDTFAEFARKAQAIGPPSGPPSKSSD